MIDKCIALVFSLSILGQAYLVRRLVGTWVFPSCLFGLFWFVFTFLPLVLLLTVPVEPYAIGFILLCALAFSISSLLFDWGPAFKRNAQKRDTEALYGSRFLKHVFYASAAASLVLIVLNSLAQGITLYDLVFNLFASAQEYANLRYSEELTSTLVERLSLVCAYLGASIGGLRFCCGSHKGDRRLIIVLSFLPSVLVALTQSAKWPFLLSVVLFCSGILAYRVSSRRLYLFGGNSQSLAIYAGIVLLIVTASFLSRGLYVSGDSNLVMQLLAGRFASYSSGHIYAFSDWFAFSIGRHSEFAYAREAGSHGFYTFATLFKLMGSQRVLPIGVYDDYYSNGGVLTTNVYTMFRGLILDFGFVGSVLFMSVVGLLFHAAFYALLSRRRPVFTVVAFLFMVSYFFSSFVVSMFGSNILYYVTFGLMWIVLYANKWMTSQYKSFPLESAPAPLGRQ
jgi:oligosaccharide repeat unit polymerase